LKLKNITERDNFIRAMKECGVMAVFHYVPLHSSLAGKLYGEFSGNDKFTTIESERLVRLPLYYGLTQEGLEKIIYRVIGYFV